MGGRQQTNRLQDEAVNRPTERQGTQTERLAGNVGSARHRATPEPLHRRADADRISDCLEPLSESRLVSGTQERQPRFSPAFSFSPTSRTPFLLVHKRRLQVSNKSQRFSA